MRDEYVSDAVEALDAAFDKIAEARSLLAYALTLIKNPRVSKPYDRALRVANIITRYLFMLIVELEGSEHAERRKVRERARNESREVERVDAFRSLPQLGSELDNDVTVGGSDAQSDS